MSYKDGDWSSRYGSLGNQAEAVFESVFPRHYRFGLNKPDIAVGKLTLPARSAPDYGDYEGLCEVVGFGRDQIMKLRIEKVLGLAQWSATFNVDVFAYDSRNERWCRQPLFEWMLLWFQYGEHGEFNEGKPYVGLRTKHIPPTWWAAVKAEV